MINLDLAYCPAVDLARMIRTKKISPVEIIQNSLARIEDINPKLNAFCFIYPDEALARARLAEDSIMSNRVHGPLHGVPIAIKDFTPTKGKRTTMGSYVYEHWVPDFDALVVERLISAGAILVGKTTTSEFACAPRSGSPLWGMTRNPWDSNRIAGFSSAGSAVAVATGCVPLAEGSDAGGSIRNPAAYCGIVGMKPSFGRIPFEILPSQLDQTCHFGPLARQIDDAALFLQVTQGPDDRDLQAFMSPIELPLPTPSDVRGLRLAFSPDLGYAAVESAVAANLNLAVAALKDNGAEVTEISLKLTRKYSEVDAIHWNVYAAVLLGGEAKLEQWREKLDPLLVRSVEEGLKIRATDLKKCEVVATELWNTLRPIFAEYDALLCPGALTPAMELDFPQSDFGYVDEQDCYHARSLAGVFNLISRCPALEVPTGFTPQRLPTGIQIVGRRYDDACVLRVGRALERALSLQNNRPSF
jgi:Asp-tRNA(Asn)/Glu-tRNA(Gln) amidotransferase A subunit family amidase